LFKFNSNIVIPSSVTLEGTFSYPTSHTTRDANQLLPEDGTILMPYAGAGSATGNPFITVNADSTLRGVVIFYPQQVAKGIPVPYPYAISMTGNNAAVSDVELLNPYQGIYAVGAHRHYIARVQGQPLLIGIYVDAVYDIGRIENVHWNPWFSMEATLFQWQMQNGRAFVFGRADWEYVLNTFAFGYNVGYHFIQTSTGAVNGNFLGIGADDCYAAVKVDALQPMGLQITNGEFTSFHGPDPTEVLVGSKNVGKVSFVNTVFWGPGHQIAKINGTGSVSFIGCSFVQWNADNTGRHAIQANEGSLIVQGCDFQMAGPQVSIGPGVKRAVITGNLISGPVLIDNKSTGNVQIGLNSNA